MFIGILDRIMRLMLLPVKKEKFQLRSGQDIYDLIPRLDDNKVLSIDDIAIGYNLITGRSAEHY